MNILYVMGTGSKWYDNELRYSLRSLAQASNSSQPKVYIVGYIPDFINTNIVNCLPTIQLFDHPSRDTLAKILQAIDFFSLKDFTLMADDIFLLGFLGPKWNLPYSVETLETLFDKQADRNTYHVSTISNSIQLLQSRGIESPVSFEGHSPIYFNATRFKYLFNPSQTLLYRSCYYNQTFIHPESVGYPGYKVRTLDQLDRNIGSLQFISTNDNIVLKKAVQDWFKKTWPVKSRYEV